MNVSAHSLSRRTLLRAGAAAIVAAPLGIGFASMTAPKAHAAPVLRGTVIDYSAGVPSAKSVRGAGHMGAIRYVTPRPDLTNWAKGKPVTITETLDYASQGLAVASVYQHGAADWREGAAGVVKHAPVAIAYHVAAGGPRNRPIYIAVDANPTREQYVNQIRPFLMAFSRTLATTGYQTGVYGNYQTIEWATQDGIGEYFWQHDWGNTKDVHPRARVHQKAGAQARIDGILVDINNVYAEDWGQWIPGELEVPTFTPGAASNDAPAAAGNDTPGAASHDSDSEPDAESIAPAATAASAPAGRPQTITIRGVTVPVPTQEQISQAIQLARALS